MAVGSALTDFRFHLGGTGAVCPCDVTFLFGFGFHFVALSGRRFLAAGKHDTARDNFVYVISSEVRHMDRD